MNRQKLSSLKLLLVVQATHSFRGGVISPILALFIRRQGYSVTQIGLIGTAWILGYLIFEPIAGAVADRLNKKHMIIFAIITSSVIYLSYTLASNIWHFYLLAFTRSSVISAYTISNKAMIAELLPSSGRGQTYGRYSSVVSMGGILGPILGGYLTNVFSYEIPFYIYAGVGIISLIAVLYMKVDGEQPEDSSTTNPIKIRDLMTKIFLGILIIRMLFIFNFIFRQDTLPIFLNESTNFNVSETEIGIYMGVVRFSTALSQLFLGTLTDRIGSKKMIISSLVLIGVTNITMLYITGTFPLYSLGLIQGISIAAANLSMMIYLISTMPKGRTGMVMGIYSEFENIGGLFSSPLIGMIYDNVGPSASVLFVTSIIISNSVLSVFLLRS